MDIFESKTKQGKTSIGKTVKAITKCRICGSKKISDVLTLGNIHVARFSESDINVVKAPLTLCWCGNCTYLQLRHDINLELVFYPEYGYESGVNPAMVRELGGIVESTRKVVNLEKGDIWLDIASNDGTLLLQVKGEVLRVGFDPSKKVALRGAERLLNKFGSTGSNVFVDYFSEHAWKKSFPNRKAKVITAIAVFYSVQDPNEFLNGVRSVLHDEGIFVVQQNYTPEMVKQLAFCNVVNEHVTYPTFTSFKSLVEKHSFEVADVLINDINGGSFRVYLKHAGAPIEIEGGKERVRALLKKEYSMGYLEKDVYENFARRINEKGRQVKNYLLHQVRDGKKVYGLAASTRGNTRLQVWKLGPDLISGIAERNPRKIGKKTLGIPIVSDDEALKKADILFVSIWFYGDSVIEQYRQFLNKGGKMLFPSSSTGEPCIAEINNSQVVKKTIPTYD